MSRLSLRLRLTLAFAAAMALVLAAVGAFLYLRLGDELDEQLQRRLAASAAAFQAAIDERGVVSERFLDEQDVAQVIATDGTVTATTPSVAGRTVLTPTELADARDGRRLLRRYVLDDDPVLLLAEPVEAGGGSVMVVGASLESRNDSLNGLLTQLAIVAPVALLLASLGGYALAGAALRPVDAMRRRAETISSEEPHARLPLPIARDEIRRLGETLNAMLDRLEDGIERERRFVADASHQLRTPLATLRTELDLALRRPRSNADLETALRSASEEADRLARLADHLLLLARSDAGRLALHLEPIPARDVLESVAARFARPAAGLHARVTTLPIDGVVVTADRMRLDQALDNLVDNALRHGNGRVELGARVERAVVVLSVRDHGAGFPTAFLPHAFEPFSRADEARGGSSAGLGLAIVEAIAAAHGGTVRASNVEGGALVELRLPSA